jgi:hypothetical protein
MSVSDPTEDTPTRITRVEQNLTIMLNILEIMSEDLRLMHEAAQNDDGATKIADELTALRETVEEAPKKVAETITPQLKTLADDAATRAISGGPC